MIEIISDFFSYDFIRRALLVGGLVSLCAALLGVSLVLKRYSMIGDGLSHVGFGALSIAMALGLAPRGFCSCCCNRGILLLKIVKMGKIKVTLLLH